MKFSRGDKVLHESDNITVYTVIYVSVSTNLYEINDFATGEHIICSSEEITNAVPSGKVSCIAEQKVSRCDCGATACGQLMHSDWCSTMGAV